MGSQRRAFKIALLFSLAFFAIVSCSRAEMDEYSVVFVQKPEGIEAIEDSRKVSMVTSTGWEYECILPVESAQEAAEDEDVAHEAAKSPIYDYISRSDIFGEMHMSGECMLKVGAFWTYEFCPLKHIRQYHFNPTEGKVDLEYYLGSYASLEELKVSIADELSKDSEDGQFVFKEIWKGGTVCDITDEPRDILVSYECVKDGAEGVYIGTIVEFATCKYEMVVKSPSFCKFLRVTGEEAERIECYVVSEGTGEAHHTTEEEGQDDIEDEDTGR